MRTIAWIAIVVVAACGNVDPTEPDGAGNQPDANTGPDIDAGSDPIDGTMCTADQFIACEDDDTARLCNASGNGFVSQECGAPGCNGAAQRCNECTPSLVACDGAVVERCDADGLTLPDETCATTCIDAPTAHCEYLSPHYLADVCDAPATEASFAITVGTTLDTSLDTACTGGVVNNICVVRATTISIETATLTVVGSRPLALVADDSLTISGTLDVSANGTSSGPGGNRTSGNRAGSTNGGGGAGFKQNGQNGGSTVDGGGSTGGAVFDPLAVTTLVGGAHMQTPPITGGAFGGGGGGAATLIACRGAVTVSGTIDAGGGGGGGGIPDPVIGGATAGLGQSGAGGGGSGGYVVIQGMSASITGRLYANGGAGGGGASGQTGGQAGGDATRAVFVAAVGGNAAGSAGGKGGNGGTGPLAPTVGRANLSGGTAGGGGGSPGHFQIYVPTGVTPTMAPIESSPVFEPTLTTPTR